MVDYPSLPFFQQVVDPQILDYGIETVHVGAMNSQVQRVALSYGEGHSGLESVMVKVIAPGWPDDPYGADRERYFYERLLPRLDIPQPHVFHVGVTPSDGRRLIVLQDLTPGYCFPPISHRWTQAEAECVLGAYARFHAQGRACLFTISDRSWLLPSFEDLSRDPDIPRMAATLQERGVWGDLEGMARLFRWALQAGEAWAKQPVTLIHNDCYPPNVALPRGLDGPGIIIDWGMLSWGKAEMDLADFFLQPFRASCLVDREVALRHYWEQRHQLGDMPMGWQDWLALERYAEVAMALSLVPVAYGRALEPLPAGSPGAIYWEAMFDVLYERLAALCRAQGSEATA